MLWCMEEVEAGCARGSTLCRFILIHLLPVARPVPRHQCPPPTFSKSRLTCWTRGMYSNVCTMTSAQTVHVGSVHPCRTLHAAVHSEAAALPLPAQPAARHLSADHIHRVHGECANPDLTSSQLAATLTLWSVPHLGTDRSHSHAHWVIMPYIYITGRRKSGFEVHQSNDWRATSIARL